jgi:hypothetical protein
MIKRAEAATMCVLLLSPTAVFSQAVEDHAPKAKSTELACSQTGNACGLSEPKMIDRYRALAALFVKTGDDFSFSADVVAAVLETTGHGRKWKFAPEHFPIFPLTVPHMDELYRVAKRYPGNPFEGSAFVVVDVPGLGPKAYDADVMRLLLSTELFPDELRIVNKRKNGASGEYVPVRSEAAQIISTSFETPSKELFDTKSKLANDRKMPALASALTRLPVGDEFITLGPALELTPFELFSEEQIKSESPHRKDWTGCDVRFLMNIPRRPAHLYSAIDLKVTVKNPADAKAKLCGPPILGITPEETTKVTRCDREVIWHLSGSVLESNDWKYPPFALFVEYPKSATLSNLILDLFLVGFPKDPADKNPPPPPSPIAAECK